jgi:hypothetical protein
MEEGNPFLFFLFLYPFFLCLMYSYRIALCIGFTTWTSSTGSSYTCNHCGPQLMQEKQKKRHLRSAAHKIKPRLREQMNNKKAPFPRGHNTSRSDANKLQDQPSSLNEREIHCPNFNPDSASPVDSGCRRSSNNIALAIDGMIGNTYFEEESREEDNALRRQIDQTNWMEYKMERIWGELSLDEDVEGNFDELEDSNEWFPFKSKMASPTQHQKGIKWKVTY